MSRLGSSAASALLGAALAAVAFVAEGGSELSRTTWTEIALILAGGLVTALAIVLGKPRPAYGALAVFCFALLVAVTALSMLWSVVPALSWQETSRVLAYFAVFTAAVAAVRLAPDGWAVALRALALAGGVVIGYALISRVWPGSLAENEIYARMGQPFGYSNAVGVTAALTVPAALWLGTRRAGHAAANALAYPLLAMLLVAMFLSYSRSSLAAAGIGALLWLVFVPLRLRTLVLLLGASVVATPVIVWAASRDGFTEYNVPIAVRESVGPEFGALLAGMVLLALLFGIAANFRISLRAPATRTRMRFGTLAGAGAVLVPVLLVVALAASERGLGGTVEHQVSQLTAQDASSAGGPERLASAGSSRGQYWREAEDIFQERRLEGAGAGTFGTARLQVRDNGLVARHAHGYVVETMADLGIAGLVASGLVLIAWLLASLRAVGLWRRLVHTPWDPERVGLVALFLVAIVFGLQSAVDWTWFVPAPTVMALVAAGWLAGRGPLRRPEPAAAGEPAAAEPTEADTAVLAPPTPGTAEPPRRRRLPLPRGLEPRHALAALSVITALLAAWATWQPERADAESDRALRLIGEDKLDEAAEAAENARDINPLASKPLLVTAAVHDARDDQEAALRTYETAVKEHPAEPQVWIRLADYQLHVLNRPQEADKTVRAALKLDPRSEPLQNLFFAVQERLRPASAPVADPAPAPPVPVPEEQPPIQPAPPEEPVPPAAPPSGGTPAPREFPALPPPSGE